MIRLEALSNIPSASKFYLRLPRLLGAVNSVLRVNSTFLQDLSVDFLVLVKAVDFLDIFKSPGNHGWPGHPVVIMSIRRRS